MSQHTFIAQPDTVIIPRDYLRAYEKKTSKNFSPPRPSFRPTLYLYSIYDFELCRAVMKKLFPSVQTSFQFINEKPETRDILGILVKNSIKTLIKWDLQRAWLEC